MYVYSVLAILLVLPCLCLTEEEEEREGDELPGHMQPLGAHMPPEYITRVSSYPTPSQFVEQYIQPKQPVIFEGLMKDLDVRKNWANDDYLRSVYQR